jgi:hypothetical protein
MAEKKVFQTDKAAVTGGPYSQTGSLEPETGSRIASIRPRASIGVKIVRKDFST